ncbi:MAG: ABC transporter ATP-binding protein [Bacillota bacterium]|nr:ABC transporter ATP-binding protein [Bacillota bacterium]
MSVLEVNKLTKFYHKKSRGIIDVSFSIEEGETFGFIGPNGSGKSTTIRTLLNFIYPTSGTASIFGMDAVKQSREIRKNVGYLPSEVDFYDDMKVIDLLNYSSGLHGKTNSTRIKELAERLDLDLTRRIEDLSFGNKKKVGIVKTLLHQSKLLILDEPTSGLDPLMQNTFFELLEEERKRGVTIFFSSHILSEVQRMCDRVAIIKDGRLIKVETVENLTKNSVKRVTLTFEEEADIKLDLEGTVKREVSGRNLIMLYEGDMKSLITKLGTLNFKDVLIEEPSLEDVFMHYYEK